MNLFYYSTIAGLLGAVVVNGITYLFRALSFHLSLPWEIASSVFLDMSLIHTPAGIIIGLIGTLALSTATALIIAYLLRATGYHLAGLKGVIVSNTLGFINLGLFMRLLNIWPQIRFEPATNIVALIGLTVLGWTQAEFIKAVERKTTKNLL